VRRQRRHLQAAGLAAVGAGVLLSAPWLGPLALVGALPLALAGWRSRSSADPSDSRLQALAAALTQADLAHGTLRLAPDRAWLEGEPASSRAFAQAVADLLGPVRHPRYLLAEPDGAIWPVPDALGETRALADTLANAWTVHVGSCEVLWARQGRGRDWLREAWRNGAVPPLEIVEHWD
jgi:hypothetical protein